MLTQQGSSYILSHDSLGKGRAMGEGNYIHALLMREGASWAHLVGHHMIQEAGFETLSLILAKNTRGALLVAKLHLHIQRLSLYLFEQRWSKSGGNTTMFCMVSQELFLKRFMLPYPGPKPLTITIASPFTTTL